MNASIDIDKEMLAAYCRKWHVRELSLFGSALRDDFGPSSDVDFLVSFEPDTRLTIEKLLDMKEELASVLGREVDIVETEAIRNPWRRHTILSTREVLYANE